MAAGSKRVGHAEREAAAAALGAHYAAGRLTAGEFGARLDGVYAAVTAADLALATADLPPAAPAGPGGAGWPGGFARQVSIPVSVRRAAARALAAAGLLAAAAIAGTVMLVAALAGHGGLLAPALVLLAVPLALAGLAGVGLVWLGRRAWRSGAWLEMAPAAAGAPWLGVALRAVRVLLVGRAFWRLAGRAGRPVRRGRGSGARGGAAGGGASQDAVWYQAEPGGEWRQARVGGLSGTSK